MNPNWLGVISAILAFAAFFIVHRYANDLSTKLKIQVSLSALFATIPGASFATYYAHILPEPSWYYQFRSAPGTELLIVFLGVAGGIAATLLPRKLLLLPLLGVAAFSVTPIIKPIIGPIPNGTLRDRWDEGVCLQSTQSTCGPASVATILSRFGVEVTESQIAAEAHSYSGGTEAWYLARAIRSRGLNVKFEFMPEFQPAEGLPTIAGVRLGPTGHFIAILGREGEAFIVGDPLRGRELLSHDELQQRYDFTGFHMRIKAPANLAPPSNPLPQFVDER